MFSRAAGTRAAVHNRILEEPAMAKARSLVGLDVHATKIVAAVLDAETGQLQCFTLSESEGPIGDGVGPGDVVVAHDALSAALCQAVRARGAHAVWRIRIARSWPNPARQALEFVGRFTPGI